MFLLSFHIICSALNLRFKRAFMQCAPPFQVFFFSFNIPFKHSLCPSYYHFTKEMGDYKFTIKPFVPVVQGKWQTLLPIWWGPFDSDRSLMFLLLIIKFKICSLILIVNIIKVGNCKYLKIRMQIEYYDN